MNRTNANAETTDNDKRDKTMRTTGMTHTIQQVTNTQWTTCKIRSITLTKKSTSSKARWDNTMNSSRNKNNGKKPQRNEQMPTRAALPQWVMKSLVSLGGALSKALVILGIFGVGTALYTILSLFHFYYRLVYLYWDAF